MNEMLTAKDVSSKFKMPLSTVRYLVQSGQIPFYRLGKKCVRFASDDLDRWLMKRKGIEYRLKTN